MVRNYYTAINVILLLMCIVTSCKHKELDFSKGQAEVVFDWGRAPSANPDGMLLIAFTGSSQPVTIHFPNPTGGDILLPPADYRFIAQNDNTEDLRTRGWTWENYEIYSLPTELYTFSRMFARTRSRIPRAEGTDEQEIIFEPNELWVAARNTLALAGLDRIVFPMEPATEILQFVIEGVENLDNVLEIAGTISGMSGSICPASGKCSEAKYLIPFVLENDHESTLTGSIRIFRHTTSAISPADNANPQAEADHKLVFYFMLSDGTKYWAVVDVTEQLNSALNDANHRPETPITISVEKLNIPEPLSSATGMDPAVDNWQEIEIDIVM